MKPVLAITMGDPASIGPELCLRLAADPGVFDLCRPLIIGDAAILRRAQSFPNMPDMRIHPVSQPGEARYVPGTLDVLDLKICAPEDIPLGQVSPMAGHAAFCYVVKAIQLAMTNQADATVTNALHKEALNLAGHPFAGHTEIYAHYTGVSRYAMLLADEDLRIVHVSTHISLREACDRVKKDRVLEVIRMAHAACRHMGIDSPRIGVAGLNPHCGEGGLFGREEIDEIIPAVEAARTEGISADGPVSPDTVFSKARGGWYDIVVAMFHDQGHIPLKLSGFVYDRSAGKWQAVSGVNITLGLPIIRTSVDHGTAFDQAGMGTASEISLRNAVEYAVRFALHKPAGNPILAGRE